MSYEVKTPMLLEAAEAARAAIAGIRGGSLEARDAAILNSGAARLIGVVATDVKARLAEPRIRAFEAKMVGGAQPQIAAA